jgi:hypothetical protein
MSVKDVIKNSVYESLGAGSGMTMHDICLILFSACLVGVYIFVVYKYFSKSAFYSKDLNVTLAGMTIIVAAIMVAMQSNLIVSLGMVGALSIVRFRTAVKNPIDLLYLFWAISGGIISGVGLYTLAAVLCIIMTIALWILSKIPNSKAPALIVLRCSKEAVLQEVENVLKDQAQYLKQVSVMMKNGESEVIYEIRTKNQLELMQKIGTMKSVLSVNWLEHKGEMRA